MLGEYPGTVIIVSHDRDFLDRVATSTLAFEGDGKWVEYAGGYSDMLAQRGEVTAAETVVKKAAAKQAAAAAPVAAPAVKKLSFKQQHELKTLTGEIDKLHAAMKVQENILATPDLYTKDAKKFQAATATLAALHKQLETAESRWLELEVLREG